MNAHSKETGAVLRVPGKNGSRSALLTRPFLVALIVCLFSVFCFTLAGCQARTKGQYDVSMGRSGKR